MYIFTYTDLMIALGKKTENHYLMNDINCGAATLPACNGYTGTFDGNGFVISNYANANYASDGTTYAGFISKLSGGTIKNVGLSGTITHIANGVYAGGIVGKLEGGMIQDCWTSGAISGDYGAGGLVGDAVGGTVRRCYATGNTAVTYSSGSVGGAVGIVGAATTFDNCFCTGTQSGGFFTHNFYGDGAYFGTYQNCWSSNATNNVVNLAGSASAFWASTQNVYDTGTHTWSTTNWTWSGSAMPTLTLLFYTTIDSWLDLYLMRNNLTAAYTITADLDKSSIDYIGIGDRWTPIPSEFTGTLNGQNYTISDLRIIGDTNAQYVAFIAGAKNGWIRNLNFRNLYVENNYVAGIAYAGGIVGSLTQDSAANPDITNCHVEGIIVSYGRIGGIVGTASSGTSYTASIIKCSTNLTIMARYVTGGMSQVGGIVGYQFNRVYITDCYAEGNYYNGNNASYTGGIAGYNGASVQTRIHRCCIDVNFFNTNSARIKSLWAGGIIGYNNHSSVSIMHCAVGGSFNNYHPDHCGGVSGEASVAVTSVSWFNNAVTALAGGGSISGATKVTSKAVLYDQVYTIYSSWSANDWLWPMLGLPELRNSYNRFVSGSTWNTSSNWSYNRVPNENDKVLFSSDNTSNCNIDTNIRVRKLVIDGNYNGTITQNYDSNIQDYTQLNGTYDASGAVDWQAVNEYFSASAQFPRYPTPVYGNRGW